MRCNVDISGNERSHGRRRHALGTCTRPGYKGYIHLDSVVQASIQSSCIHTSMSVVFLILHISFTSILPAITLFNAYYVAFMVAYVPQIGAQIGDFVPQ